MTVRKQYTKEFKLDAVSLVYWIREYQTNDAGQAFRGNAKLTPEQEEIRQLKAQIRQLDQVRADIYCDRGRGAKLIIDHCQAITFLHQA